MTRKNIANSHCLNRIDWWKEAQSPHEKTAKPIGHVARTILSQTTLLQIANVKNINDIMIIFSVLILAFLLKQPLLLFILPFNSNSSKKEKIRMKLILYNGEKYSESYPENQCTIFSLFVKEIMIWYTIPLLRIKSRPMLMLKTTINIISGFTFILHKRNKK